MFSYKRLPCTQGTNGDSTDPDADGKSAKQSGQQRNWEKQKAPWMDELRASQAKKTSPINPDFGGKSLDYEQTAAAPIFEKSTNASFDMSKSFSTSYVSSSSTTSSQSARKSAEFNNFSAVESKAAAADVQLRNADNHMARSVSGMSSTNTKVTFNASSTAASTEQQSSTTTSTLLNSNSGEKKPRPTSMNLRNRSISPIGRLSATQSVHISAAAPVASANSNNAIDPTTSTTKTVHVNNFVTSDLLPSGAPATALTIDNVCPRVQELEQKVSRLERLVQQQAQTIDELMRTTRDESDKVKTLRGELDKYAQCVTQV